MSVVLDNLPGLRTLLYGADGTTLRKIVVDAAGILYTIPKSIVVADNVHVANAVAGTNNINSAVVGAGKKWRITHLACRDLNNAPTRIELTANRGAVSLDLLHKATPIANELVIWDGEIILSAGDTVTGTVFGALLNDDLFFTYMGEEFNA